MYTIELTEEEIKLIYGAIERDLQFNQFTRSIVSNPDMYDKNIDTCKSIMEKLK